MNSDIWVQLAVAIVVISTVVVFVATYYYDHLDGGR